MKHVYEGKTKSVYQLEDGSYLLCFKDDVTGENGKFDPGANTVGLSIEGIGRIGVRMTKFFYEKIEAAGFPTHFISADVEKATMNVKPATVFGKGLEVICRYRAVGSFFRRYGAYATEGQPLDALVEVTLKDDNRNDPPITKDMLEMLGILSAEEYETLKQLTRQICNLVREELAKKNVELYDIKLEFGRINGKVALIDEISGGNMRAYQNGRYIEPLELAQILFG